MSEGTVCLEFKEHHDWRDRADKSVGVTWDGWCSVCGFRIADAKFDGGPGLGLTGNGRRLARFRRSVVIGREKFLSEGSMIFCSVCAEERRAK